MHVRAGFRAVVRQPALALGEIVWRWAFGAAAWTLVILAIRRLLAHVDITQAELLIARHSDLILIADACARMVVQVLPQIFREGLVLIPTIAVLWIAAATIGRAVTLQTLLSSQALSTSAPLSTPALLATDVILSEDVPYDQSAPVLHARVGAPESKDPCHARTVDPARTHFGRLAFLNALRALFTLATLSAFLGTIFLAGLAMPAQSLTVAAAIAIVLALLVAGFWSVVNWFLALAPIWMVRDGRPTLSSILDSVELFRRTPLPYFGIASWFGLLRGLVLLAALFAGLIASQAALPACIALCVVIALIYFAIADFLYVARLGAFVALNESW